MIADGNSYEQILWRLPHLTYMDIFAAAAETLSLAATNSGTPPVGMAEVRKLHTRAYEVWSVAEVASLEHSFRQGETIESIAQRLKRQPSAIRSRLQKQGLIE